MYVSRFRDFRSRAARTYALDNGIFILFGPLLARDRPEIDFWHTFKAKKVTLYAMSENRKSQGREKGSVHFFIPRKTQGCELFLRNRKIAKPICRCRILRLSGAGIAEKLEKFILATFSTLNA